MAVIARYCLVLALFYKDSGTVPALVLALSWHYSGTILALLCAISNGVRGSPAAPLVTGCGVARLCH